MYSYDRFDAEAEAFVARQNRKHAIIECIGSVLLFIELGLLIILMFAI